jgi:hypothetical protein
MPNSSSSFSLQADSSTHGTDGYLSETVRDDGEEGLASKGMDSARHNDSERVLEEGRNEGLDTGVDLPERHGPSPSSEVVMSAELKVSRFSLEEDTYGRPCAAWIKAYFQKWRGVSLLSSSAK